MPTNNDNRYNNQNLNTTKIEELLNNINNNIITLINRTDKGFIDINKKQEEQQNQQQTQQQQQQKQQREQQEKFNNEVKKLTSNINDAIKKIQVNFDNFNKMQDRIYNNQNRLFTQALNKQYDSLNKLANTWAQYNPDKFYKKFANQVRIDLVNQTAKVFNKLTTFFNNAQTVNVQFMEKTEKLFKSETDFAKKLELQFRLQNIKNGKTELTVQNLAETLNRELPDNQLQLLKEFDELAKPTYKDYYKGKDWYTSVFELLLSISKNTFKLVELTTLSQGNINNLTNKIMTFSNPEKLLKIASGLNINENRKFDQLANTHTINLTKFTRLRQIFSYAFNDSKFNKELNELYSLLLTKTEIGATLDNTLKNKMLISQRKKLLKQLQNSSDVAAILIQSTASAETGAAIDSLLDGLNVSGTQRQAIANKLRELLTNEPNANINRITEILQNALTDNSIMNETQINSAKGFNYSNYLISNIAKSAAANNTYFAYITSQLHGDDRRKLYEEYTNIIRRKNESILKNLHLTGNIARTIGLTAALGPFGLPVAATFAGVELASQIIFKKSIVAGSLNLLEKFTSHYFNLNIPTSIRALLIASPMLLSLGPVGIMTGFIVATTRLALSKAFRNWFIGLRPVQAFLATRFGRTISDFMHTVFDKMSNIISNIKDKINAGLDKMRKLPIIGSIIGFTQKVVLHIAEFTSNLFRGFLGLKRKEAKEEQKPPEATDLGTVTAEQVPNYVKGIHDTVNKIYELLNTTLNAILSNIPNAIMLANERIINLTTDINNNVIKVYFDDIIKAIKDKNINCNIDDICNCFNKPVDTIHKELSDNISKTLNDINESVKNVKFPELDKDSITNLSNIIRATGDQLVILNSFLSENKDIALNIKNINENIKQGNTSIIGLLKEIRDCVCENCIIQKENIPPDNSKEKTIIPKIKNKINIKDKINIDNKINIKDKIKISLHKSNEFLDNILNKVNNNIKEISKFICECTGKILNDINNSIKNIKIPELDKNLITEFGNQIINLKSVLKENYKKNYENFVLFIKKSIGDISDNKSILGLLKEIRDCVCENCVIQKENIPPNDQQEKTSISKNKKQFHITDKINIFINKSFEFLSNIINIISENIEKISNNICNCINESCKLIAEKFDVIFNILTTKLDIVNNILSKINENIEKISSNICICISDNICNCINESCKIITEKFDIISNILTTKLDIIINTLITKLDNINTILEQKLDFTKIFEYLKNISKNVRNVKYGGNKLSRHLNLNITDLADNISTIKESIGISQESSVIQLLTEIRSCVCKSATELEEIKKMEKKYFEESTGLKIFANLFRMFSFMARSALSFLTSPLGLLITGLGTAIGAALLLFKNLPSKIINFAKEAFGYLKQAVVKIYDYAKDAFSAIKPLLNKLFDYAKDAFSAIKYIAIKIFDLAKIAFNAFKPLAEKIFSFMKIVFIDTIKGAFAGIKFAITVLFDATKFIFETFKSIAVKIFDIAKDAFPIFKTIAIKIFDIAKDVFPIFKTITIKIFDIAKDTFPIFKSIAIKIFDLSKDAFPIFKTIAIRIFDIAKDVFLAFKFIIGKIFNIAKDAFNSFKLITDKILNFIKNVFSTFKPLANNIFNIALDAFSEFKVITIETFNVFKSIFISIPSKILAIIENTFSNFKSVAEKVFTVIKSIFIDVKDIIKNVVTSAFDEIKNIFKDLYNIIKNFMPTNLPNKVEHKASNVWHGLTSFGKGAINLGKNAINFIGHHPQDLLPFTMFGAIGSSIFGMQQIPHNPDQVPAINPLAPQTNIPYTNHKSSIFRPTAYEYTTTPKNNPLLEYARVQTIHASSMNENIAIIANMTTNIYSLLSNVIQQTENNILKANKISYA